MFDTRRSKTKYSNVKREVRNYMNSPNITQEHATSVSGPDQGIYIPDCTWQVCLTSKCFPAWSEARGLKSARLSRIGYCTWCESPCSALRPAIREPGSRPLRYRAVHPRRMNESKKTKKLSDGFSSYINEDKAADILFKVQLTYMTNHSLLRNWNLILYIKNFLYEVLPQKKMVMENFYVFTTVIFSKVIFVYICISLIEHLKTLQKH